jgi:hypothetical protein
MGDPVAARRAREAAAALYRPQRVRLLLVAEAPPSALNRYFYFEDVRDQDSLFRYVSKRCWAQRHRGATSLLSCRGCAIKVSS